MWSCGAGGGDVAIPPPSNQGCVSGVSAHMTYFENDKLATDTSYLQHRSSLFSPKWTANSNMESPGPPHTRVLLCMLFSVHLCMLQMSTKFGAGSVHENALRNVILSYIELMGLFLLLLTFRLALTNDRFGVLVVWCVG